MSKLETMTVRVVDGHPKGSRWRAGMNFTGTPVEVEVDADAAKAIREDPYLMVVSDQQVPAPSDEGEGTEEDTAAESDPAGGDDDNEPSVTREEIEGMRVADLKAALDGAGVAFSSKARHPELVELLCNALGV